MPKELKEVRVFAPATVANVACGFDILGFAVSTPGDELTARLSGSGGAKITSISGDGGKLSIESDKNTAAVAVNSFLRSINSDAGIEIQLDKKMPLGSGLGSSAASAAAGVFAANLLLGTPLKPIDIVPFAMEGERIACGAAHADNVAPALLGGFVLVRSYEPLDIIQIPAPPNLYCTIIRPHIELRTEDARRILRKEIPLKNAITQWGNIGGLIAGLFRNDLPLIGRSLQDVVVEPERALLIPGFERIKEAAISSGALGCSISGSGPALFALSDSESSATTIGGAMQSCASELGMNADIYVSLINSQGARIIAEKN